MTCLHLARRDVGEDLVAPPLPVGDAVEAVLLEPLLVDAAGAALGPHVLGQERDAVDVVGRRATPGARRGSASSFSCLAPQNPTLRANSLASRRLPMTSLISPLAYSARRQTTPNSSRRSCTSRASCSLRVEYADLDRVLAEVRHAPVALEQRLEERLLHVEPATATRTRGCASRRSSRPMSSASGAAPTTRVDVLDVELVQRLARRQRSRAST